MKILNLLIIGGVLLIPFLIFNDKKARPEPIRTAESFPTTSTGAGSSSDDWPVPRPSTTLSGSRSANPSYSYSIPAASNSSTQSAGSTKISKPKVCRRSELRIVRGKVIEQVDNGWVMECTGWIVQGVSVPLYAGDGPGMNVIYGNLVETHEQFAYGRLMTADHGVARLSNYNRSMWNLGSYVVGRVLLRDYPGNRPIMGQGVKVVALPAGVMATWRDVPVPVYTANFDLID